MIFLDFEASAGMGGYPIEVGFCMVNADRSMRSGAKLIRCDEWLDDPSRWDWRAEEIHRIARRNLTDFGESPRKAMTWLNAELAGMVAVADSPMDELWMRELAEMARIPAAFGLTCDIRKAFDGPEIACITSSEEAEKVAPKRHRAEPDAVNLATRYVLSLEPAAFVYRLHYVDGGGNERRPLSSD